jgi:hypothetical protein
LTDESTIYVEVRNPSPTVVIDNTSPIKSVEVRLETMRLEVQTSSSIGVVTVGVQGPQGVRGTQGPQGDPGNSAIYAAAAPVGGKKAVVVDLSGAVAYADCSVLSHARKVAGISLNAANTGDVVVVQTGGRLEEPGWDWDTELPIFLGTAGQLTQVPQLAGFSLIVGFPITNTAMFVDIRTPILLNGE